MAAGHGVRMKSDKPKVLHEVLGWPMVAHVVAAARDGGCSRVVLVVGAEWKDEMLEKVRACVSGVDVVAAVQEPPRGTGDAVACAMPQVGGDCGVLVLNGDLPCLTGEAVARLAAAKERRGLALATARLADPYGYGRVLRNAEGRPVGIREHKDCSEEELGVDEINIGLYATDTGLLRELLPFLGSDNAQGEVYLTDLISLAAQSGRPTSAELFEDPEDLLGVNDRRQLASATTRLRARVVDELFDDGVTLLDPDRTWVDVGVTVGADTVIEPGAMLRGRTRVGRGCLVSTGAVITDTVVGDYVNIQPYCVIEGAMIEDEAKAGPFARLRPGSVMREGSFVGNFVEMKKTDFGKGSKAGHLTYLGDATIGEGVNVGAGTITCNYDGAKKHPTILEDGVFVGSDTQFVAPIHAGKGAYIGAGTTVTKDIPAGALATARAPQTNREGWVEKRRQLLLEGK